MVLWNSHKPSTLQNKFVKAYPYAEYSLFWLHICFASEIEATFVRESSPSHELGTEATHQPILLIGNKAIKNV